MQAIFDNDQNQKKIYFCGIGGIGMSSLAILSQKLGFKVIGSDEIRNENINHLEQQNIIVNIGHKVENITDDISFFVYSSAINNQNPELNAAKKKNIPIIQRGGFLSQLITKFQNVIAVAGTHGKTSVTSMTGYLMDSSIKNTTILSGGIMNNYNSNIAISDIIETIILETDESDGTFSEISCDFGIITSIDQDHMEFYKTEDNLFNYFKIFAEKIKKKLIICTEYDLCLKLINSLDKNKYLTYGISDTNDMYPINIKHKLDGVTFDVVYKNQIITNIKINQYGIYNVLNALASFLVLILQNVDISKISNISDYLGVKRRFTKIGSFKNNIIIDDYAHNPKKISSVIEAAKTILNLNNKNGKLITIWEPHRYSRTKYLIEQFTKVFTQSDYTFILPVYNASENPLDFHFSQDEFEKKMHSVNPKDRVIFLDNYSSQKIYQYIEKNKLDNGIILFIGAGKSTVFANEFFQYIKHQL